MGTEYKDREADDSKVLSVFSTKNVEKARCVLCTFDHVHIC